jgi:hypothetical protein
MVKSVWRGHMSFDHLLLVVAALRMLLINKKNQQLAQAELKTQTLCRLEVFK